MNECTHGRHNVVALVAGESTEDGLHCLSGSVKVCQDCRVFVGGTMGSTYLNDHSLIEVNCASKAVFVETLTEGDLLQRIQQSGCGVVAPKD